MGKRKPLKVVSRVHEPRVRGEQTFPALRISGKWLREFCEIGDHYRIIRVEKSDELVIQFIRRAS